METTTTTTKTITTTELVEILNSVTKSTFIHLVTETPVRMNKRGNPYHGLVVKRSSRNYLIGNNYEDRKNNNLQKNGEERNFEVSHNRVGEHISKIILFNPNTNKYYLQVEMFENIKPKNEYSLLDGEPIKKELFEPFMVKSNSENDVQFISITVSNIKEISLNGVKYIIKNEE